MNKLLKGPALNIPDPLNQILSVPIFLGAFFGENDKGVYENLSEIIIRAAPRSVALIARQFIR